MGQRLACQLCSVNQHDTVQASHKAGRCSIEDSGVHLRQLHSAGSFAWHFKCDAAEYLGDLQRL